ncbi:fumarylacetoacetate hydrolase family protein [Paenibacillus marinisediminis]
MKPSIQNVYCIGRNYKLHALELGNDVPAEPMVFLKPSHAVSVIEEDTLLSLPLHKGAVHHELELVLRIGRDVTPGMTADEAVDGFALGIDFTLRDVQDALKKKGHPWLPAKGVLHSGPITPFQPYLGTDKLIDTVFTMQRNGNVVQQGTASEMIFSVDQLIAYVAANYGLGAGDIIFTGTPSGVGPVEAGDELTLIWNGESLGACRIQAEDQR